MKGCAVMLPQLNSSCLRCGRPLKSRKSQERGYGPTCEKKARQDPNLIDLLNHPSHEISNEQNFMDELKEQKVMAV